MIDKGIIFDIQRFSLNDGDGIRTTIFFKGCYLRCVWCHNPESIAPEIQLNHNPKKCTLCGKCVDIVNGDGIKIVDDKLIIDFNKHNQNFDLINVCPNKAYSKFGKAYSVDEVVDIVMKDFDYYKNSNGGVTFSGGEAINQIDFLNQLGKKLKSLNINMCLDMSGYDPLFNVAKTLSYIDRYLLDYKVSDQSKYEKYIGPKSNFLEIIDFLAQNNKDVTLRCPIIPKVNDSKDHFKKIADLSKKYPNIKKVDILPYHNMVKNLKFKYVNKPQLFDVASSEEKEGWKNTLKQYGLKNGWLDNKLI